ncbi:DUF4167 domain-containing protein [Breoghania sp. L-A4]|uniref:DUF4167 domain-containing protein n=1 Tax=Breoghania sp. L-A4 TaxID=2304600 RepID=UPI0020C0012C|nr:DUF4167 domain-containing protein [Breoghania sp. L-A4]
MRGRGRKTPSLLSRSFESNGPDVKVRGTAMHVAEKYQQLARDAHASGDRIMAENYYQHAEHYSRLVAAAQPQGESSNDSRDDDDRDERDDREEAMGREERVPARGGRDNDRAFSDGNRRNDGNRGSSAQDDPAPRPRPAPSRGPIMPEDAPQPFIDGMPNTNTKRADINGAAVAPVAKPVPAGNSAAPEEAASAPSAADGEEEVAKPRRRTRGTRGRGARRSTSSEGGDADASAPETAEPASAPEASDA